MIKTGINDFFTGINIPMSNVTLEVISRIDNTIDERKEKVPKE